jgi:hypothetical protein
MVKAEQNASPAHATPRNEQLDNSELLVPSSDSTLQPSTDITTGSHYEEGDISGDEEFLLIQMEADDCVEDNMLGPAPVQQLQLPVGDSTGSTAPVTADPACPIEPIGGFLLLGMLDSSRVVLMLLLLRTEMR